MFHIITSPDYNTYSFLHVSKALWEPSKELLEKCKVLLNEFKIPAVFPAIDFAYSKNEY